MDIEDFKRTYGKGWLKHYNEAMRIIKKYDDTYDGFLYQVYYLPEANYCGVSRNLKRRLKQHKYVNKRNVEGCVILFESYNKKEAYSMEHEIQRVCGYGGYCQGRPENFVKNK